MTQQQRRLETKRAARRYAQNHNPKRTHVRVPPRKPKVHWFDWFGWAREYVLW